MITLALRPPLLAAAPRHAHTGNLVCHVDTGLIGEQLLAHLGAAA
jgi:hypothetical protein